jgi:N-formylglutamate amidohydrolase
MDDASPFVMPALQPSGPVLMAVPHAGRHYPPSLLAAARVGEEALRPLEDRFADLLPLAAEAEGHAVIRMPMARAWLDLNRAEDELDSAMLGLGRETLAARATAKVRGGLGLIPTRLAGVGTLWKQPLGAADVRSRIAQGHRPWHEGIGRALDSMRARHGQAVLIDLHSMPPVRAWRGAGPAPLVVIGDRHGQSADSRLVAALEQEVRSTGLSVSRNHPYPGGYTLERHGRPAEGIHAVQIEIDRALYLDKAGQQPGPGLATVQNLVARLAACAVRHLEEAWPLAAE